MLCFTRSVSSIYIPCKIEDTALVKCKGCVLYFARSVICILCFTRSAVQVVVDILVPKVNASNGVFVAARVDQGGCTTFLARGVFFFLLFGEGHAVIATDLGQRCIMYLSVYVTVTVNTAFIMRPVLLGRWCITKLCHGALSSVSLAEQICLKFCLSITVAWVPLAAYYKPVAQHQRYQSVWQVVASGN